MVRKKSVRGFTLIEAMVVVAVIGVIAAFAFPAYTEYVRSTNRADAKAELSSVAQRLQRCFTAYSAYDDDDCAVHAAITGTNAITSREGLYTITGAVTNTTYTLTATPVAGTMQASDAKCTTLTLNQAGVRGATGTDAGSCW
ncbi:type IV pilin protein [Marinimicrobium sp. ABcell2]|uniref:type IV pilin protein n=1 Tax=Marinimicrobium sp. ABcell2 TaxID=3069751 RepID=UPI0027B4CCA0|nr:type IV pilin protein [Marinimicrobium sp. ABcell2]MDQ2078120.1 type IV pilin protein [Marinimicrobium sp. ABcell2]